MNQINTVETTQKAMNRKEVAARYGISTKTLRRWLKRAKIDLPPFNAIQPRYLEEIFAKFG